MRKSLLFVTLLSLIFFQALSQSKEILYVGTYSVRGSEGIYVYEFDRNKGSFRLLQTASGLASPTFLEIHPSGQYLYSANRGGLDTTSKSGSVHAYSIDGVSGKLTLLNKVSSYGEGPAHINIDRSGKMAFVSNYFGGNLIVYPLEANGRISLPSDSVRNTGKSVDPQRQDKPYVHSAFFSPDNKFVFVPDLGTDRVYIYEVNTSDQTIKPAKQPYATVKPGSGPRHLTFHPNGKYVYLLEELTSTVCIYSFDTKTGALSVIEDGVKSLPEGYAAKNASADIHADPDGKFLYTSNRGHNSLSIFSIDKNGRLKLLGHQETLGDMPRNFLVDKKGDFILAANQNGDNLVLFRRDKKTGMLTYTGTQVKVPSPACLKMLELK